jgi:hypothetical protein
MANWIPCWEAMPPEQTDVLVKLVWSDGSFKHDIGRWYGEDKAEGWTCQHWSERPRVAAWCFLPNDTPTGK